MNHVIRNQKSKDCRSFQSRPHYKVNKKQPFKTLWSKCTYLVETRSTKPLNERMVIDSTYTDYSVTFYISDTE